MCGCCPAQPQSRFALYRRDLVRFTAHPPPLRITKYTQITLDGQRKGVSATDGSRLYLNSDSPNLPSQNSRIRGR